jgi:hypothetical protein
LFELAAVPKVVRRPRVKAQTNGVAGAEHSLYLVNTWRALTRLASPIG